MFSSALQDVRLRWLGWRNKVLSDPAFQRFAARFPLTRPIARRRARELFDLVAGFTYSQVLAACVESGLLDALAGVPVTVDDIAKRTGLPAAGAERLLRAAAALGLAEPVGEAWTLGQAGAALRGNGGIVEMVAHHRLLYADLSDPLALLRRGGGGGLLAEFWSYAERAGEGTPDSVAGYSSLMAASQALIAEQVADAYPFARHQRLLDIGGGQGAFAKALSSRLPKPEVTVLDLPPVAERARRSGLTAVDGDFLTDPLPTGFDAISLVRVLHDHDDAPALQLLRNIRAALPLRGRLVIAEPMAATRGAEPAGDAYFGLYLLAMGSGRPRRADEIRMMLKDAGFERIREHPTVMPLTCRVMSAGHS